MLLMQILIPTFVSLLCNVIFIFYRSINDVQAAIPVPITNGPSIVPAVEENDSRNDLTSTEQSLLSYAFVSMGIMTPGSADSEKTTTQIPSSFNYSKTAAFNNNVTNESSFDHHMPSTSTMAITRTTTTAYNSEENCPQYMLWNKFDSKIPCWILGGDDTCYCFSRFTTSWYEAERICRSANMNLATFDRDWKKEMMGEHIFQIQELYNYAYWTSGKYNESISAWQWSTTGRPIIINRQRGEINLLANHCVLFTNKRYTGNFLIERNCASYGYRFMCNSETPPVPSTTLPPSTTTLPPSNLSLPPCATQIYGTTMVNTNG